MANAIQIRYKGETLCCLDQTEVKAVEPFVYWKPPPQNLFVRICGRVSSLFSGNPYRCKDSDKEEMTKVLFKDGTNMKIRMPFWEFVNAYC